MSLRAYAARTSFFADFTTPQFKFGKQAQMFWRSTWRLEDGLCFWRDSAPSEKAKKLVIKLIHISFRSPQF